MEEGDPACASRATSTATRAADAEARSRVLMKEEDPAIDADAAAEVEALKPPAGMTQRKRMLLGQVEQQPEVGHEISSEDDERGMGVAACTRKGVAERQRRAGAASVPSRLGACEEMDEETAMYEEVDAKTMWRNECSREPAAGASGTEEGGAAGCSASGWRRELHVAWSPRMTECCTPFVVTDDGLVGLPH